eukprot:4079561-Karenia_brevis.AAC.1
MSARTGGGEEAENDDNSDRSADSSDPWDVYEEWNEWETGMRCNPEPIPMHSFSPSGDAQAQASL